MHPAVASWKFNPDGSVSVTTASYKVLSPVLLRITVTATTSPTPRSSVGTIVLVTTGRGSPTVAVWVAWSWRAVPPAVNSV